MRIGFVSQNPRSHYWQIVNYGVRERATELGIVVPIIPVYSLDEQIAEIQGMVHTGIDALLIGPVSAVGLGPTVERVMSAGVPVIILAAELTDCMVSCTVRSDHRYGGELAARFLVEAIGGAGQVAHLVGPSQLQDNIDRAAGVRQVLARHQGIEVVFERETPDWTRETGAALMREALDQFPNICGVCAATDTLALGTITAIEAHGRAGELIVVGFDALPSALQAIHEGRMHATVRQSIQGIGRTALTMAHRLLRGEQAPTIVYTDLSLVTRTTLTGAALEASAMLPGILTDAFERGEELARAHAAVMRAQQEAQAAIARSAAEVRRLNQFLQRVIDDAPVWLMVVDASWQLIVWNKGAEAISGYTREEAVAAGGEFWAQLYPNANHRQEIVAQAAHGGPLRQFEALIRRKDGLARNLVWTASRLLDQQDHADHTIIFGLDITERKQAEEARRAIERKLLDTQKLESLGVLAGGIAHDFNNLLAVIIGNSNLTLLDLPADAPEREGIEQIERAALRAADLTRQMLAYAGKGQFVVEWMDLNTVVREISNLLEVSIPKHVSLQYQLAANLPPIEGDATQIRQVVMNLVMNAAEAIEGRSGIVGIATGVRQVEGTYFADAYLAPDLPAGSYVYLEVSDNGVGMDPATREQIFDPFFTTKFTGRGLGLAAVLGIARGHRGAIKVQSEPQRGSTFTFMLPAGAAVPKLSNTRAAPLTPLPAQGKILVVDDEAEVRAVVARMLKQLGLASFVADDGPAGLEMLRSHKDGIAAVLLDMTMPAMSGEEVFREMRQIKPGLRIILMSGYNEQEASGYLAGRPYWGFLHKPFSSSDLRDVLYDALQGEAPSQDP
jgi:PAS domain S-box-containing protein